MRGIQNAAFPVRQLEPVQVSQGSGGIVMIAAVRAIGQARNIPKIVSAEVQALNQLLKSDFSFTANDKIEQLSISAGDLTVHD